MWNWIECSQKLNLSNEPFVICTITHIKGSTPREVGAKMIVLGSKKFFGTIGGGKLEDMVITDAIGAINERIAKSVKYPLADKLGQCCGGLVEVFFDVQNIGPKLYVFGAGHVGQALTQVFEGTVFKTHLIDEREDWINHPNLPPSVIRHKTDPEEFAQYLENTEGSYAVVMTHLHALDEKLISILLAKPFKYVGLIGSESKWGKFKTRLLREGFKGSDLSRVHCPMGLNIGGKMPKEIAVSLCAELLSIHYEKGLQKNSRHFISGGKIKSNEAPQGTLSV